MSASITRAPSRAEDERQRHEQRRSSVVGMKKMGDDIEGGWVGYLGRWRRSSDAAVESASGFGLAGLLHGLGVARLLDDAREPQLSAVQRLRLGCPCDCGFSSYWCSRNGHSEARDQKSDGEFALHDDGDGWAGECDRLSGGENKRDKAALGENNKTRPAL
ncbi:hypothetical protein B0H14DRAFT_2734957 [Mycena olivaceomarginata]|nr:hypothetical protein B0H14DRAFT_2734957 [Mycena olivaceomarginata]